VVRLFLRKKPHYDNVQFDLIWFFIFFLPCVSVVCWATWLSKNDIVFDKVNQQPYLQILFRTTLDKISGFASEKGHEYVFLRSSQKVDGGLVIGFVYNKLFTKFFVFISIYGCLFVIMVFTL